MLKLNLHLDFNQYHISLYEEIQKGQVLGLHGKSGIGKSTLLKVIAGLQTSTNCYISYDSEIWNDAAKRTHLASKDREVGLVFQDFALFPNLTVIENLLYAQRISDTEMEELIATLDISGILNKKSNEISGGQKQRTAIGRAIAYDPKVLLLDEPFAALDDSNKSRIKTFLKSYLSEKNKIALIASHDISDLEYFTDHIVKLEE